MIRKHALIQGRLLASVARWEEMWVPVVWPAHGLGDSKGSSERHSRCAVCQPVRLTQIKPDEPNPLGFSLPLHYGHSAPSRSGAVLRSLPRAAAHCRCSGAEVQWPEPEAHAWGAARRPQALTPETS